MEDIDAAFHHSVSRSTEELGESPDTGGGNEKGSSSDRTPKVSLSGLLNALDGIGAQEGRLLFATTNRYEALDPALRRPGRMDVHVEFKLASQRQASELFRRFYAPENSAGRRVVERVPDDGESDKDSGYFTPPRNKRLASIEHLEGEKQPLRPRQEEHGLAELELLSEEFKEHIPDREVSMAALQGYLMMHKGRPHDAVECVGVWVEKEKAKAKEVRSSLLGAAHNSAPGRDTQLSNPDETPGASFIAPNLV